MEGERNEFKDKQYESILSWMKDNYREDRLRESPFNLHEEEE